MAKKKKWEKNSNDNWQNDSVFQTKVGNGKQYNTSGKSAYDLFLEDEKKRVKEAEQGKVRYTEAAKASRVQYSLPGYQGKSQNQGKTYNWERDTMQNTKVKGAGNSYTKKFDALTKSMGMTEGQASEFRKYMDFQEDSQHVDPKMNKDKSINESQSLKYARDARMQTDIIDGILDNMHKTGAAKVKKAGEVPFEKVSTWDKLQNAMGFKYSDEQKNTLMAEELGVEPHYGGKKDKTDPVLKSRWEDLQATKAREDAEQPKKEKQTRANVDDYNTIPQQTNDYNQLNASATDKNDPYAKANAVLSGEKSMHDDRNALEKVMDFLNSPLKAVDEKVLRPAERFATSAADGIVGLQLKKNVDKFDESMTPEFVRQASEEPTNKTDKVIDTLGEFAGMTAPIGAGYKIASPIAKALASTKYGQAAVRGGTAMGLYSGAQQGIDEVTNPEDGDFNSRTKNVLLNAGLGAVGDPAAMGIIKNLNLKGQASQLVNDLMEDYTKNLSGGKTADYLRSGNTQVASGALYDSLIQQANPGVKDAGEAITQAQAQKQALEDQFVRQEMFNPKGPNPNFISGNRELEANIREQFQRTPQAQQIDDLINQLTGQREGALNTPMGQPKINDWQSKVQEPAPVSMEGIQPRTDIPINNWQDNIVKNSQAPEPVQPSQAVPETQINDEYVQDALRLREATSDPAERDALDNLIEQITGKKPERPRDLKAEEDSFVSEQMKPHNESLQKAADAQSQWENTVKNAKDQAKTIKDSFGKIYVPSHSLEDYPVPKQFLASSKDKHSDDIFSFSDQMGVSPEEAVQFLQSLDSDSKIKLKDIMPEGTIDTKELRYMEEALRKQFREQNVPKAQQNDVLNQLDELVHPKTETEAIKPETAPASEVPTQGADNKLLMNLNLQRHTDGNPQLVDTVGAAESEKAVTKQSDKFYEKYVNSNHSAKVAEEKVIESAIKRAEDLGKTKTAEKLKQELKKTKKYGSDFEKAIGNEKATAAASTNFLKRHFKALDKTVKNDEEMAQFLNYQMAMDLKWRKESGLSDYELPDGVDWGAIDDMVSEASRNTKFGQFNAEMRNLTQEWRDVMLEYGLINKEAHTALSKNPHYMYLGKELSHKQNNIQRGTNYRKVSDKRASGPNIVHAQTGGDAQSLFKNPVEGLINNTFSVFKNAYKEETGRQALRMAKLDKNKMFAWEISEKAFKEHGGIKVSNGGKPRYVALQDDLMDVIKENEAGLDLGVFSDLTSAFAGLKTRSLEYQTAALIRDTGTAMVTSQISNPLRYFKEYTKSLKNGSKDAKRIGGIFDNAHNAQTAGLDPNKVLKEFQRQHGNVTSFNPKKPEDWKGLARTVGRILDTPFKYTSKLLGQVSDEIPRDIEARETERLFMKQNGKKIENIKNRLAQVDEQLRGAEGVTDPFDPALQGIDKLKGQKDKLETMLQRFNQDLRREQVYRSRDVINYSRAGRGKLAKGIRKYMIFANTTTQSKDKMIRSFIERPGATIAKAAVAMAPLVAAQKLMFNTLGGEDKDIYERVPSYIKMNNFVFVYKGNVYTVPKIQELALVTNPIEAVLHGEKLNDVAKYITKETVPYQAGNFAQGLVPDEEGNTLFDADPMTKNMMGVTMPSFLGTPLADVAMNDKTGFNRKPISFKSDAANKWTPSVFKKLVGDNVNADRVDYLIRQYFGDYGKAAVYGADYGADLSNTDKLDELLRNLNPLQDRIYRNDSRFFKAPILDKKK